MEGGIWGGLAALFRAMDGSEFGYLLLALMVPPLILVWALFKLRDEIKRQHQVDKERFETVVRMYEDNVVLVRNYEKTADGLQTVIHLSTKAMTMMMEKINNNHYCPIVRERSKPDGGL